MILNNRDPIFHPVNENPKHKFKKLCHTSIGSSVKHSQLWPHSKETRENLRDE